MNKKARWLLFTCLLVVTLVMASCTTAVTEEEEIIPPLVEEEVVTEEKEIVPVPETVAFPDEKLGSAIRDALDKPPGEDITAAELAELISLNATKMDITDLSGIEYCVNLSELNLWRNRISDPTPLASLTNLTKLNLSVNRATWHH
ncbi:hypothetical protein ACFLVG_05965 [Chloroflexota bacterium]